MWGGGFQYLFPFQQAWFCQSHHCFWILFHHTFHTVFQRLFVVCWEMSLCSSNTFLWLSASAGDFKKSSFFFINGFSNSSVIFSCCCHSGIQFLGRSLSSSSMVQISNTSPSLQSFSVKAMTWSLGRCRCSWWLKFTITNGVTASGFLSYRSANMGYVQIARSLWVYLQVIRVIPARSLYIS